MSNVRLHKWWNTAFVNLFTTCISAMFLATTQGFSLLLPTFVALLCSSPTPHCFISTQRFSCCCHITPHGVALRTILCLLHRSSLSSPTVKHYLTRQKLQVPPRFELGSLDSESRVLTITPWNPAVWVGGIYGFWFTYRVFMRPTLLVLGGFVTNWFKHDFISYLRSFWHHVLLDQRTFSHRGNDQTLASLFCSSVCCFDVTWGKCKACYCSFSQQRTQIMCIWLVCS